MKNWYATASLAALMAASALSTTQAFAQTADETAVAAEDDSEEIVVTAQKRTQRLQDVPIVVTAVGQKLLQDTGVKDVKDLMQVTPGLSVTSTNSEATTTARIRGVGTVGDNPGLESSVGIVVDGIYRPRAGTGIGDLGELERVEILKGPQGTLFGKNTSAGVINVITAAPDYEFHADGVLTYGNYDAKEASLSVTGKLAEGVAGRLYVASRERDGFYDIVTGEGPRTQDYDANRNFWTARGQLLIEPDDKLSIRIIGDYTKRDETCCAAGVYLRGPAAGSVDLANGGVQSTPLQSQKNERIGYANRSGQGHVEDMGLSVQADWDLDWGTVTSITGIRKWTSDAGQESDFSTADLLYRRDDGEYKTEFQQFSQEVRIAGESGDFTWLVGGFYASEQLDQSTPLYFGDDLEEFLGLRFSNNQRPDMLSLLTGLPFGQNLPGGSGYHDTYKQDTDTFALFTNDSYKITEQLELTVGLRYTYETKDLDSHYTNMAGGANACAASLANIPAITQILGAATSTYLGTICATFADPGFNDLRTAQSHSNDEFTGTAKLSYKFTDEIMAYASYARGYKSGGYNLDRSRFGLTQPDPNTYFPAEFVDSYEIGAKTRFFDNDVTLNLTGFYQKFTDFQLNTFTGISYIVASIPQVKSAGVDLDMSWRTPIDGLSLQGGLTYANTRYGNFDVVAGSGISALLPGHRLNYAPIWSGTIAATYETDINDYLAFHGNVSARYSGDYNTGSNLDPVKEQDSYWNLTARFGIGSIEDDWRVELWGANLTDEKVSNVIFDATLQTGTYNTILAPPRTYGVTLRLSY